MRAKACAVVGAIGLLLGQFVAIAHAEPYRPTSDDEVLLMLDPSACESCRRFDAGRAARVGASGNRLGPCHFG